MGDRRQGASNAIEENCGNCGPVANNPEKLQKKKKKKNADLSPPPPKWETGKKMQRWPRCREQVSAGTQRVCGRQTATRAPGADGLRQGPKERRHGGRPAVGPRQLCKEVLPGHDHPPCGDTWVCQVVIALWEITQATACTAKKRSRLITNRNVRS